MEAHDGRPELVQHVGRLGTERQAACAGGNGRRIDPERLIVVRKRVPPRRVAFGTGRGRRVAEEIHVERLAALGPDCADLVADGLGRQQRARERAQAAGLRDRNGERAALNTGHGRLHDGELDAEELLQ